MTRARTLVAALSVAIGAVTGAGCGPRRTLGSEESDPIRVGLIVPLQGELGADGPHWRDAVRLAVREVNSAGGPLPGRMVELVIADSESTVEGARAAYEDLRAQGVVAIVGDAASSSTIAVYEQILADEVPVVLASGLSTSPRLTEMNAALPAERRWFFRTVPPDDGQYRALADAMYEEDCRNIALLYANNDYGVPFRDGVRERFRTLAGARVAIEQGYMEALADYSAEVRAVAAAMPDCIALIAYPQSAGVIVRNWAMLPMRPAVRWFGTDGVYQPGFPTEVGDPTLIDGFLGTAPVTMPMTPAYNRFVASYRATFGTLPVAFSSNLYDAAALIMLAIAHARSTDPAAIRDSVRQINDPMGEPVQGSALAEALRSVRLGRQINYEGASGSVDVDEVGNVRGQFELWRYSASAGFTRVRILE